MKKFISEKFSKFRLSIKQTSSITGGYWGGGGGESECPTQACMGCYSYYFVERCSRNGKFYGYKNCCHTTPNPPQDTTGRHPNPNPNTANSYYYCVQAQA